MSALGLFFIWIVGFFLVPKIVKPLEVGYGLVTIMALVVWSIIVLAIALD